MGRRIAALTLDTVEAIPAPCRSCVFWELSPMAGAQASRSGADGAGAFEKEAWLSDTLLEWGACGSVLYVDEAPVGFVVYAPPRFVPRAGSFPTSPVGPDAVLLTTAYLAPEYRGGGLGRVLVQTVARDLVRRGVRAIEAFGDERGTGGGCIVPAGALRAVGFTTVRPHRYHPRLRLELRTALSWREDAEAALERLLGSMSPDRRAPHRLVPIS